MTDLLGFFGPVIAGKMALLTFPRKPDSFEPEVGGF
jgi:hypothetical protein